VVVKQSSNVGGAFAPVTAGGALTQRKSAAGVISVKSTPDGGVKSDLYATILEKKDIQQNKKPVYA